MEWLDVIKAKLRGSINLHQLRKDGLIVGNKIISMHSKEQS